MSVRAKIREVFRSPRNKAVDDVLEMMDGIEQASRQSVTFCQDCGSRRIVTRWPDGTAGYLPGHPDAGRTP